MRSEAFGDNQALLSCWKDIAHYMGKGVRTVQRWEQELALPVRRPHGGRKGPVTARPADLDNWLSFTWSERRPSDGHGRDAHGQRIESSAPDGNALIETSQRLRRQNRALIADLKKSVHELHLTCLNMEPPKSRGADAMTNSSELRETNFR